MRDDVAGVRSDDRRRDTLLLWRFHVCVVRCTALACKQAHWRRVRVASGACRQPRAICATLVLSVETVLANPWTGSICRALVLIHPGLLVATPEADLFCPVSLAALPVEALRVLAAVGDPVDAFVESMARIRLDPVFCRARAHHHRAIILRSAECGETQGLQLLVHPNLTHAWPLARSAAGEARRDARGCAGAISRAKARARAWGGYCSLTVLSLGAFRVFSASLFST